MERNQRTASRPMAPQHQDSGHHGGDHEDHLAEHEDKFTKFLQIVISLAIRVASILMVLVVIWSVVNIGEQFYTKLVTSPFMRLTNDDIVALFGAFLTTLIAAEIFINFGLYAKRITLPVKLVLATALMAIARKIIAIDFTVLTPLYLFAVAAIIFSVGLVYWLITHKIKTHEDNEK